MVGKTFPVFTALAQPAILRIWQEVHAIIKLDQLDPWIKDQLQTIHLSKSLPLQLQNCVQCGRACLSFTKFRNCGVTIKDSRTFPCWISIHRSSWFDVIKAGSEIHLTRLTQGAVESISTSTVEHILIIIASAVVLAGLTYAHVRFCGRKLAK